MKQVIRITLAASAVALAALGLAACSGGGTTSPVGSWGTDAQGETSLEFADDGSYSGSDGCNRVMGSWEAAGNGFSIGPMASTMMACQGVDVWLLDPASVEVNGDTLVVLDSSGNELGTLDRN